MKKSIRITFYLDRLDFFLKNNKHFLSHELYFMLVCVLVLAYFKDCMINIIFICSFLYIRETFTLIFGK